MNGPKPLSSGEGGFVRTDDDETYYRLPLHGHHSKRCRSEIPTAHPPARFGVTGMGLMHRTHPLAAALGLQQLGRLDHHLEGRASFARYLCEQLAMLPGISVPQVPPGVWAAWYGLPLTYVPDDLDGLAIEQCHQALIAEGLVEVDRPGSTCP